MSVEAMLCLIVITFCLPLSFGHDSHNHQHDTPMTSRSMSDEIGHIEHHMEGVVDINRMAEDELRFLYFKMHDSDQNDKLDGCELVHSLLHWHTEECKASGHDHGTTRIFRHEELELMVDPILASDDKNFDGFIDFPEFVAAQKSRGF